MSCKLKAGGRHSEKVMVSEWWSEGSGWDHRKLQGPQEARWKNKTSFGFT